jgi:hypothetical protein
MKILGPFFLARLHLRREPDCPYPRKGTPSRRR